MTHKTDAVMRLLTGSNLAVNPMLDNEFKQSVIEMHSAPAADEEELACAEANNLIRIEPKARRSAANPDAPAAIGSEICISSELVTEYLPVALQRFGCCTCGKCFAEAMADALDTAPYIAVKIRSRKDTKKAELIRESSRREICLCVVRIALARKSLPRHKKR